MSELDLVEVDSLEALVIIDNELDPLSPPAPDTVQVSGLMGSLALQSTHELHDRGEAKKELQMEDICCSAHGYPSSNSANRAPGGLVRAIELISEAKIAKGHTDKVSVDLHPDRPDYRGFALGPNIVSFQADPTFEELEAAGGAIQKNDETHTVLDNFFLISGEIPRQTAYENGIKGGMRYDSEEKDWFSDELISDERFLMCNLKDKGLVLFTGCSHAGVVNCSRHAVDSLDGSVPLYAVVGGFHLATSTAADTESTVKDLQRLDPAVLLPGHCSGWRAKFAIEKYMPGSLVPCTVGAKVTF
ncbi:hypothetical protein APSETT444_005092 [Aspergillus pseudonomiae]